MALLTAPIYEIFDRKGSDLKDRHVAEELVEML